MKAWEVVDSQNKHNMKSKTQSVSQHTLVFHQRDSLVSLGYAKTVTVTVSATSNKLALEKAKQKFDRMAEILTINFLNS